MLNWKAILRFLGVPLIAEGCAMLLSLIPALHFSDGTALSVLVTGCFTLCCGALLVVLFDKSSVSDRRTPFVMVVLLWIVLALFGSIPFLVLVPELGFADAFFESMSGLTSTGATIFPQVESLPASLLFWRSVMQWVGGFGIILLVLAITPSLGINKYSLYTAEASGADNTGKTATSMGATIRRMLWVYLLLTTFFVVAFLLSGMQLWDAVNLVFANISSGGFSIYNDSAASLTSAQQYLLALTMFCSGINFALVYSFFTLKWKRLKGKLEQFSFYLFLCVSVSLFSSCVLHFRMGDSWSEALQCGVLQSISMLTTTGSLAADTTLWWTPLAFLFVLLSLCGGMAGSTTGGLKIMRVMILMRNVRTTLSDRLHPHAVNPVRLNGKPVSEDLVKNVMVTTFVYFAVLFFSVMVLMLCGINATESIGATVGCITGYGPGLGLSGGFGSYMGFTVSAKFVCSFVMLMGRLECLTVLILFSRAFWKDFGLR